MLPAEVIAEVLNQTLHVVARQIFRGTVNNWRNGGVNSERYSEQDRERDRENAKWTAYNEENARRAAVAQARIDRIIEENRIRDEEHEAACKATKLARMAETDRCENAYYNEVVKIGIPKGCSPWRIRSDCWRKISGNKESDLIAVINHLGEFAKKDEEFLKIFPKMLAEYEAAANELRMIGDECEETGSNYFMDEFYAQQKIVREMGKKLSDFRLKHVIAAERYMRRNDKFDTAREEERVAREEERRLRAAIEVVDNKYPEIAISLEYRDVFSEVEKKRSFDTPLEVKDCFGTIVFYRGSSIQPYPNWFFQGKISCESKLKLGSIYPRGIWDRHITRKCDVA